MVSKSYLDGFIPTGVKQNECIKCGRCLQKCLVMKIEQEDGADHGERNSWCEFSLPRL